MTISYAALCQGNEMKSLQENSLPQSEIYSNHLEKSQAIEISLKNEHHCLTQQKNFQSQLALQVTKIL